MRDLEIRRNKRANSKYRYYFINLLIRQAVIFFRFFFFFSFSSFLKFTVSQSYRKILVLKLIVLIERYRFLVKDKDKWFLWRFVSAKIL